MSSQYTSRFKTDFHWYLIKNTTIDDTGFLALLIGTTAQRVGIATTQGSYNTTTNKVEGYYEPVATGNQLVVVLLVVEV